MNSVILKEPVLVGRESELEELRVLLDSAIQGKGTTVFISGEAGAGKTRLTAEFLKRAKQKGVALLYGWCLSDAAVPYFPFTQAFDTYFSNYEEEFVDNQKLGSVSAMPRAGPVGIEGFGITAWLTGQRGGEKLGVPGAISPQVWKDQLFAAVGKTLHLIAEHSPTILLIEDIHWADSASLSLLHYISRIISSQHILMLATFRSEELTADAEGHPHPLAEVMRLMRREDLFAEIKLPNLSQDGVSKIVENMIGGSVNTELVDRLTKESRGNALFLVESLRMLAERKSLVQEKDQWRLAVYELGIPSKVKDIILRRMGILKNDQRRILDAASVIGEKFDLELLATVLGQDSLSVLETLNVISRSTSLVCVEGNSYRFDHAKSREALYSEIPPPLRNGYHTRIAERLESKNKNGELPLSDLAFHFAQAGNMEKATKYAMTAAQDELARFSNAEAYKHFKFVLNNLPDASENTNERLAALEGLGDALYAMSLLEEAAKTFGQLIDKAESGALKLRALKKAMLCAYWLGNVQGALEVGGKAEDYAESDRLEYARLRLHRGFITGRGGKNDEAIEDMEQALKVFEEEFSPSDVADALVELAFIYRSKGRGIDALSAALRSVLLYEEIGDMRGQGLAYSRLAGPFNEFGLTQKAFETLAKSITVEEKVGDYNLLALHYWAMGQTFKLAKNFKEAVPQYIRGIEYAEKTDGYYVLSLCYSAIIDQYALLGETECAEDFVRKLEKLLDKVPILKNNRNIIAGRIGNLAAIQIAKGQLGEATETLEGLLISKYTQSPEHEAKIRANLGRLMARQGKTEESKTYFEEAKKIHQKVMEALENANLQANLMAPREIGIDEELNLRLDIVNVTQNPISLVRIYELCPSEFKVTTLPSCCNPQNGSIEMGEKVLKPFTVESIKLTIQVNKPGVFSLAPQIVYAGDLGEHKTLKLKPVTVTVRPMLRVKIGQETLTAPILLNRVSTGFTDLDYLLLGGIPENYSVILASPSIDERELLIKKFLEGGAKIGETTFYLTAEPNNGKALAEQYTSNFYFFVCNPQVSVTNQNLPNVIKLKGVENLNEIDIALLKVFRTLNLAGNGRKRACIEIVSDILLQHRVLNTRKWLSALLPDLKAKGFTTLAVIDPQMHHSEESRAIISLFDGEIAITEKETPQGFGKTLKVKKLVNQKYLETELPLSKEKLSA